VDQGAVDQPRDPHGHELCEATFFFAADQGRAITTGYPSMLQFELYPAQINDLLAYLQSIQG
jgi:hypothetical protein